MATAPLPAHSHLDEIAGRRYIRKTRISTSRNSNSVLLRIETCGA